MLPATEFIRPSHSRNYRGEPRRIGIELEFAAISARDAAKLLQEHFGGELQEIDRHSLRVTDTYLGDFRTEIDSQYVRSSDDGVSTAGANVERGIFAGFRRSLREIAGDVASVFVPCEVVCPPIEIDQISRLDEFVAALNTAGALGTRDSLIYAFGAQLNPEIANEDATYLSSVLKAYLLLSDWLRDEIDIDITRRVLDFANPFPPEYARIVVHPSYRPDRDQLISDYLAFNPTRNRELDMLPLFAWLDQERITERLADPLIKSRPTFHYRLPDANFGDTSWTIAREWNRWCVVEALAANPELLERSCNEFVQHHELETSSPWIERSSRMAETVCASL